MHSTPAGCEAWSWVDGLEDTESEGRCTNFGNATLVNDAATLIGLCLLAKLAVLTVSSLVYEALDVKVLPVVKVLKL
jgi:hypothetical protein